MSFVDKAKNKVQETAGKVKEKVGDATDNDDLRRDGQADQAEAGVKQTGEKVKDGATDAKHAVKDTFTQN